MTTISGLEFDTEPVERVTEEVRRCSGILNQLAFSAGLEEALFVSTTPLAVRMGQGQLKTME